MATSPKMLVTAIPAGFAVKTTVFGSRPKFILAYPGYELDRHNNVVCVEGWKSDDPRWESLGIQVPSPADLALRAVGLYSVGFPPRKVTEDMRQWAEWEYPLGPNGQPSTKRVRRVRVEKTRLFPVNDFAYAFHMEGVETSMGFGIDIDFTVIIRGVNPETALVHNNDWYLRFEAEVEKRVRDFVGGQDFFSLLTEAKEAHAIMKVFHPLRMIIAQMKEEATAKHIELPKEDPFPPFADYITGITVMAKKEPGKAGSKLEPLSLAEGLGIQVTDAMIEDISISKSETKLLEQISIVARQQLESAARLQAADTELKERTKRGEGVAAALKLETNAREDRWTRVDSKIAESPGGTALAIEETRAAAAVRTAELAADALGKVATAVKESGTLTTVVFPNGGAQPVVPVGNK